MTQRLRSLTAALFLFTLLGSSLWAQPADPAGAQNPAPATAEAESDPAEPAADPNVSTPPATVPPPAPAAGAKNPAAAVRDAAVETRASAEKGADAAVAQGSLLLSETLIPMWQRLALAFPALIKAVLLLLAFWLVALVLAALVRRLLDLSDIDERAVKAWGLEGALHREGKEPRSVSLLAGQLVKWTVLLFGFVAFFQAIDLGMVAKPLQDVASSILGVIPNLLAAAVILVAYWLVATLVRTALSRGLDLVKFDEKAAKYLGTGEPEEGKPGPTAKASRLAFYVVLFFGLPPLLDALGQTALVVPLTGMLTKALGILPNLIGAVIIFFVGKLLATVVREVVGKSLAAAGFDGAAGKLGAAHVFGDRRPSDVVGLVAYFFLLVSVIVAAVESLGIEAISVPIQSTLTQALSALPLVFVALIVMAVGYMIARAVRELVESFLRGVGFDQYPERFGLAFLAPKEGRTPLSAIGGLTVMVILLLMTAQQALGVLELDQLAGMVGALISYLPSLLAALAIGLVALYLSKVASRLAADALGDSTEAKFAAPALRFAIIFLGVSMALEQLGVGEEIVRIVVMSVLAGTALAVGLAFGLGGRDRAKALIDQIKS